DTLADSEIETRLKKAKDAREQAQLKSLLGKVAIANGKQTYQLYQSIFSSARWKNLASQGAQTQRVLWASTSTKDPAYRDVLYVEELIGPDTVNTIPPATLDAFRDHGHARLSLTENVEAARETMETLAKVGISIDQITSKLTEDGVRLFKEPFDKLLQAVEKSTKSQTSPKVNRQTYKLPETLTASVKQHIEDWRAGGKVRRLWQRDASLWTGTDEANWLGWLSITEEEIGQEQKLRSAAEEIKKEGFRDVLVLGMGGSSLCPEVVALTFGSISDYPKLYGLDS